MVDDAPVSGLMAGDDVLLRLKLTNNAAYDTTWKNVATLTIADSKVLTFTVGSSDSAYARAIKPGESADFDYHLTVRNDAEVGSTSVAITMTYETWDSVVGKATQTIMLPVSQPMDVVVDEPVVYGNAVSGKPIAVSLNIINMGRAKAMNLQVMATDGLTMAESYFGGDLLAGGSVAADVQVDAAKTGEFTGTLIVAYEDANGERYTQEIAVPMNVAESAPAAAVDLKQSDSDDSASSWPWWAWLLIVAVGVLVVGTAAALAVQIRRKKAGAGTAQAGGSDRPADGGGAGSDAR